MSLLAFFRKPIFALPVASMLFFCSCSGNDVNDNVNFAALTNPVPQKSREDLRFSLLDYKDFHQKGYVRLDGNVVRFDLDLTNGITYDKISKIDDNSLTIEKINGNPYDLTLIFNQKTSENKTYIDFRGVDFSYSTSIDGLMNSDDFIAQVTNNQGLLPVTSGEPQLATLGCPPCIGVVVGIIVGGIYCVVKSTNSNNNCLQAYNLCLQANDGNCNYTWTASTCGGTCSIIIVSPLENHISVGPM